MLYRQVLGWVVLLGVLAGCGTPATPPSASTAIQPTSRMVVATPGPLPPNAEPNGRAWGPADAPIKVLKFVDYQCPTCGKYSSEYDPGIVDAFAGSGKVRYEVRILTFIGGESYDAGMAALCAADQNAFWRMHRSLFINQPFDGRENVGTFTKDNLRDIAAQLDLDMPAFNQCLDSQAHKATLDQDRAEAQQYGVSLVPTLVINGKIYRGARSADDLRAIFAGIAPDTKFD